MILELNIDKISQQLIFYEKVKLQFFIKVKINAHSYKGFRESIQSDRFIKLINLMLRITECGIEGKITLQEELKV